MVNIGSASLVFVDRPSRRGIWLYLPLELAIRYHWFERTTLRQLITLSANSLCSSGYFKNISTLRFLTLQPNRARTECVKDITGRTMANDGTGSVICMIIRMSKQSGSFHPSRASAYTYYVSDIFETNASNLLSTWRHGCGQT